MPDAQRARRAIRRAPLLTVLVLAACSASSTPSATPPATPSPSAPPTTVASPSASATPAPTISAPPQPGSQEVTPSSPPKDVGAVEAITVFTHCGFEGRLDWAGSFWRETGREPEGGPIGDPEDSGRLTLINATTARFESSTGTVVVLERVAGPLTLQPCD
jgi:hypothetical protein